MYCMYIFRLINNKLKLIIKNAIILPGICAFDQLLIMIKSELNNQT